MKDKYYLSAVAIVVLLSFQGCAVIGGIFKAGAATGIIAVVAVIAIIIFIFAKAFGGKK